MFVCYNCFIFAKYIKLIRYDTFDESGNIFRLCYLRYFCYFFILLVIAGAKDPTAMYGVPKEKIINALDSLVELQKKVEKIEKHIDTEKGDKETTEESQSPE